MSVTQFLGAPVSIKTTAGQTFQGEVFCYDVGVTQTVVLKEPQENGNANFRVIKTNAIREIKSTGLPPLNVDTYLPPCDPGVLEKREMKAIAEFETNRHNIGVGVTEEAQDTFNFIHKTHPDCRWSSCDIVVMGVTVSPPYGRDNCLGGEKIALERIQQVIEKFRERRLRDGEREQQTASAKGE
eukprot:Platyproteum_vivax@DN16019_c0_g1_i1.p1